MKRLAIGGKTVGDGAPAYVIAEMAWAHDGSRAHALEIVRGAAAAGADAVNVHVTSMPDYMVPDYGTGHGRVSAGHETRPVFDYLTSIALSPADWEALFLETRRLGLALSAMCNDGASLAFAARFEPEILLVHASALTDLGFVRSVARCGRPVFLGIGGSRLGEVERAVDAVRAEGNDQLVLQYGFQSYPTRPEDVHLRFIATLKALFGTPIAFADHTDGADPLAVWLPIVAVAMGASVIEKHVTHDRSLRGEDFEAALDLPDLARMVGALRASEQAFGSGAWRPLSPAELSYREVVRKRAVASARIEAGEPVGPDRVTFMRADAGLSPEDFERVAGRRASVRIERLRPITSDLLE